MKKYIELILKKLKQGIIKHKTPHTTAKGKLLSGFAGKTSKKFFTSNDSLSLDTKQVLLKEEINAEAKTILKEAIDNPEILVTFIKSKGTRVVKSGHMKTILFLIGEQEGFLPPMKGFKAFIFNILVNMTSQTKLNIGLETPALFALDNKPVNIYFLSHQFHLWLSYVNELPGFDETTRKNFKNVWDSNANSMELSQLSIEEIVSLKDAIARDIEAIKFVKEMTREFVGQKQVLNKIKQGQKANL